MTFIKGWNLNGNTVGSEQTIGTNDALDVVIESGGTERLRVDSADGTITLSQDHLVTQSSVLIGDGLTFSGGGDEIVIGSGATGTSGRPLVIGREASISGGAASECIAIGSGATIFGTASNSVAIGRDASSTTSGGVAIGDSSSASDIQGVGVGTIAVASGDRGVAIGAFVTASGDQSIAIGRSATASNTTSVALGRSATTNADNQFMIGSPAFSLNTFINGTVEASNIIRGTGDPTGVVSGNLGDIFQSTDTGEVFSNVDGDQDWREIKVDGYGVDPLSDVLAVGNSTGGTDLVVTSGDTLKFETGFSLESSATILEIAPDTGSQLFFDFNNSTGTLLSRLRVSNDEFSFRDSGGGDGIRLSRSGSTATVSTNNATDMSITCFNATSGNNNGRSITMTAGDGFGTGNGGNVTIGTGAGNSPGTLLLATNDASGGSNGTGGTVQILAGDGDGSGEGGDIQVTAGQGNDGGDIVITGGSGVATGGDVAISSGIGPTSGDVTIQGLTYPSTDGDDGYVVTTDGAGNLALEPLPASDLASILIEGNSTDGSNINVAGSDRITFDSNYSIDLQALNNIRLRSGSGTNIGLVFASDTGVQQAKLTAASNSMTVGDTSSASMGRFLQTTLEIPGSLQQDEAATVPGGAPAAGEGKVWVRNDAPNKLMFTDDASNDWVVSGNDNIETVSTNTTITDTDERSVILVDASGGNVNINLPTASDNTGRKLYIKAIDTNGGTNTMSVVPEGAETLDQHTNGSPFATTAQWDTITVVSNGTNWFIL